MKLKSKDLGLVSVIVFLSCVLTSGRLFADDLPADHSVSSSDHSVSSSEQPTRPVATGEPNEVTETRRAILTEEYSVNAQIQEIEKIKGKLGLLKFIRPTGVFRAAEEIAVPVGIILAAVGCYKMVKIQDAVDASAWARRESLPFPTAYWDAKSAYSDAEVKATGQFLANGTVATLAGGHLLMVSEAEIKDAENKLAQAQGVLQARKQHLDDLQAALKDMKDPSTAVPLKNPSTVVQSAK